MKTKFIRFCVAAGLILGALGTAEAEPTPTSWTMSGGTLNVFSGRSESGTPVPEAYAYKILGINEDLTGNNNQSVIGDRSDIQWFDGNIFPHIFISGTVSEINLSFTHQSRGMFTIGIIGENPINESWNSYRDSMRKSSAFMGLTGGYSAAFLDYSWDTSAGTFDWDENPGSFDFDIQIETQLGTNGQGRLRVNGGDWSDWLNLGEDRWGSDDWSNVTLIAQMYSYDGEGIPSSIRISNITITIPHTPAPGAFLLGSIGVGLVGWLRRRRTL